MEGFSDSEIYIYIKTEEEYSKEYAYKIVNPCICESSSGRYPDKLLLSKRL